MPAALTQRWTVHQATPLGDVSTSWELAPEGLHLRSDGGRSFMRALPGSDERDAIVAALRERLGSRWVGQRLPLQSAQKRFQISARGDGLKVAAIIGSAFVLLMVLVLVVGIVGSVLCLPAVFAVGAWLFHKGRAGLFRSSVLPSATISKWARCCRAVDQPEPLVIRPSTSVLPA